MKKVKISITLTIPDEVYYSDKIQNIKNEILSGKLQRDTKDEWGDKVIDCKTTFETLK